MDALQKKSIQSSRGFTYTYYVSNPVGATPNTPPLLLQHGFPDDAHTWQYIIAKLPQYRIIAPDLLGYGGTSKPTNPSAYEFSAHTKDLTEILDQEGVEKVISVGHDWGSTVAQRLYLFHPDRVAGVVLLNVPYLLPSPEPFDIVATNDYLEKTLGFTFLGYQEFLITDEAPGILKAHADRVYDGMHGAPRDWILSILGPRGKFKEWLLNESGDLTVEPREYAKDPEHKRVFVERFRRDGFEAPVCYYKASCYNIYYEKEKSLSPERLVIKVPLLYFGCSQDGVCRPELMAPAKAGGFVPDLEEILLDCSHWSPLEAPDSIASGIQQFLSKRF
ncbi:hypothetical protein JX265_000756 [Neoarthrinium moseri]|uniref:AB hydrolase-1 domain-containing protein n=1 Tax=Neoarthrinium moseri TaxID=1658444 RepID=A0A9P9WWJ9_9PEZI|nr:uncharacterized protein JN550_007137 [Neoarthrinium moseri]KAI1847506.1 hypothetical protein JX266_006358 [Neoarthrinium moseri]KAI1867406.1 hypothetical protein JN550_007137 [Neoarthrinium moseri]KAI1880516.1 hypothetical protein JX265_000756 [Neoarthrinium moseri]